ncbi:acetylcholine receptor subunit alpha-like 1 isoform X1 [Daktulosphaira vitifoliae]|uniref:acetylcholine receptor subunit alpha-like 1 isoform X1 n=1 Tax=Daktulosphaira vitifoliae TaxID=58002 RepID=UPI0021A9CD50|nr:acetylcholine receptor subunit alpha-like 1 isoform X1 [Daktulosphaira vitifoliae]
MDVAIFPKGFFIILFLQFSTIHSSDSNQKYLAEHKLREKLLKDYEKLSIPTKFNKSLEVKFNIVINNAELNYEASQMLFSTWIVLIWIDDRLNWSPSNFSNLETIIMSYQDIWRPDILPYNNIDVISENDYQKYTNCRVDYNGTVILVQPSQYNIHCDMDMKYWPYDEQTSTLRLGSWVQSGNVLNLTTDEKRTIETHSLHSEWDITNVIPKRNIQIYPCCPEEIYIDISYNITIKRRTHPYKSVIYIPALCNAVFNLVVFWMPYDQYGKIIVNLLNALLVTVFTLIIYSKIPIILSSIPIIVIYYTYCLGLTAATTIISLVAKRITMINEPLPHNLTQFLRFSHLKYLGIETNDSFAENHILCGNEDINIQVNYFNERQKLALVIDRFCFTLFIMFYFLMFINFIV